MSQILCIESGTDICSVALARRGELLSLVESGEGRQHARMLAVYVEEILRANGVGVEELDAVAVGRGPGSYTGLRIGVSLAKALCYATGKPLIAINSLESMVHVALEDCSAGIVDIENPESALLCPMIDARRMEVYCQLFNCRAEPASEIEAKVITPESFAEDRGKGDLVLFGGGAKKCMDILQGNDIRYIDVVPSARGLVKPAFAKLRAKDFEDVAYFEPFYLKDFVVTTSAKRFFD